MKVVVFPFLRPSVGYRQWTYRLYRIGEEVDIPNFAKGFKTADLAKDAAIKELLE